jgi:hypothetical protein
MNAEIGTEAAHFPEKEYINGTFVAVHLYNLVTHVFFTPMHCKKLFLTVCEGLAAQHRLNVEVDLQSLFGLNVT